MIDATLKEHFDANCNHDLLSKEEEIALFKQLRAPCDSQGVSRSRQAYHRLWMCNQKLILSVVRRYGYRHALVTDMDLIQAGQIGLAVALRRFDPSRGNRLSTYATWWIRYYVQEVVLKGRPIPIPMERYKLLGRIFAAESYFIVRRGRLPQAPELAAWLNERVDVVEAVLRAAHVIEGDVPFGDPPLRLQDERVTNGVSNGIASEPFKERIPDPSNREVEADSAMVVESVVDLIRSAPVLTDEERDLALRYLGLVDGEADSFKVIAADMGLAVADVKKMWSKKVLPFLQNHPYLKGLLDAHTQR